MITLLDQINMALKDVVVQPVSDPPHPISYLDGVVGVGVVEIANRVGSYNRVLAMRAAEPAISLTGRNPIGSGTKPDKPRS